MALELQNARAEAQDPQRAGKDYDDYLTHGKAFLAGLVEQHRRDGIDHQDGVDTNTLALAFENAPNQFSATALVLYLTKKCIIEDGSQSEADSIWSAFAQFWDNMSAKLLHVKITETYDAYQ
ncbi:hypothetical protein BD626DRAFT_541040 [Schizophyllum amplum]|uniref:Uncharacterized protein n=1 Tax=Schizophyllum amplum TaxID=97359 RepID=A0A550BW32_9AGAR|nr:hypothetical protein BD626DRAFT_541040 [Auriculariopsis ampla]